MYILSYNKQSSFRVFFFVVVVGSSCSVSIDLNRSRGRSRLSRRRLRVRRIPLKPRLRASSRPTGSRALPPTLASRGCRRRRLAAVPRHGQPFSRAHCGASRWPPFARRVRARAARPTGSRARARPLAAPRAGRPPRPQTRTSTSFHGQPFSAQPLQHREAGRPSPRIGARSPSPHGQPFSRAHSQHLEVAALRRRTRTSTRPTGTRSRAPTCSTSGGSAVRQPRARTPIVAPWAIVLPRPLAAPRGGRPAPQFSQRVLARSTGSRSRAPTSASRAGRRFAAALRLHAPRAAVRARPLQHLEVAALRQRLDAQVDVLRSTSSPRLGSGVHFSTSEVAALRRRPSTHPHVPRAARSARAHCSISRAAAPRRERARRLVPRAAVRARPLQHLEVAAPRRARARPARPTGSRSRAPTSASRGGRPSPRTRTSPRPTGSRSRAPTSAPRGGRAPPPRSHTTALFR